MRAYLSELIAAFGNGWNRFWFTPSDPLILCLIRVLTGSMLFVWLATISLDLVPWFGIDGLINLEIVRQMNPTNSRFSLLDYASTPGDLWAMHVVALATAACLTVGLATRATSVLSLIVALSYVHRAPAIMGRFEPVMTMVLAYLCLAPCGACVSLDRRIRQWRLSRTQAWQRLPESGPRLSWSTTVATRLIQLNLAGFYLLIALTQLQGAPWWDGSAVWWLLADDSSRLVDWTGLAAYPDVVQFCTHVLWLTEFTFVFLVWHRLARPIVLCTANLMWLLLMPVIGQLGYCLMMMIASLAFVSPDFVRRLINLDAAAARSEEIARGLAESAH
jgi:hypothetical protein